MRLFCDGRIPLVEGLRKGFATPHLALATGGKVGCLRDAPSSPSDGVGSFVVLGALGEAGGRGRLVILVIDTSSPISPPNRHRRSPLSQSNQQTPPASVTAGRGRADGVGGRVCDVPHLLLGNGGKVGCLRVAPSSPSDGVGSVVVLGALGEAGGSGAIGAVSLPGSGSIRRKPLSGGVAR